LFREIAALTVIRNQSSLTPSISNPELCENEH